MPKSISHITKVEDVREVVWEGELDVGEAVKGEGNYDWGVYIYDKKFEPFTSWFDKLSGKRVRVTVTNLDAWEDPKIIDDIKSK
jgi:hypothetical protein